MSIWTHVVGNIRVDGVPDIRAKIEDVRGILGRIGHYGDEDDESVSLPSGSEGSLQYAITQYDDGCPWITIAIWGDLRDYPEERGRTELIEWWFRTLDALGERTSETPTTSRSIRDAILKFHTEGSEYNYVLDEFNVTRLSTDEILSYGVVKENDQGQEYWVGVREDIIYRRIRLGRYPT